MRTSCTDVKNALGQHKRSERFSKPAKQQKISQRRPVNEYSSLDIYGLRTQSSDCSSLYISALRNFERKFVLELMGARREVLLAKRFARLLA